MNRLTWIIFWSYKWYHFAYTNENAGFTWIRIHEHMKHLWTDIPEWLGVIFRISKYFLFSYFLIFLFFWFCWFKFTWCFHFKSLDSWLHYLFVCLSIYAHHQTSYFNKPLLQMDEKEEEMMMNKFSAQKLYIQYIFYSL